MTRPKRTNPLVYEAILEAYRDALVQVLRTKLSETEVRRVFKAEILDNLFRSAREVGRNPSDVFDVLDVPNSHHVVRSYVARILAPSESRTEADELQMTASMRRIVEARHWVSHPSDSLPLNKAEEALNAALFVLRQLGSRSRRVEYLRRQLASSRPQRTSPARRNQQLPTTPPLFGRSNELNGLIATLGAATGDLVTLCGEGGIGKTRLAIEVAHKISEGFRGGATWVPLAEHSTWEKALSSIATAVGLRSNRASARLVGRIKEQLARTPQLLVLDNLEHLVKDARVDLSELARDCEASRLLITSRETVGIANERQYVITGLAVPRKDDSFGDLQASASVVMFVERARRSNNLFAPSSDDYRAIAELCRKVDGLPLAIELLASSLGDRSIPQLLTEWTQALEEIKIGKHDRHASMQASFRWSWSHLTRNEQSVLCRQALVNWPASLDTTIEVRSLELSEDEAVAAMRGLVRKSLVTLDSGCYDLHLLVRRYAALECSPEVVTATRKAILSRVTHMIRKAQGELESDPELAQAFLPILLAPQIDPQLDPELVDFWLALSDPWVLSNEADPMGGIVLNGLTWLINRMPNDEPAAAPALVRSAWLARARDENLFAACSASRALEIAVERGDHRFALEAADLIAGVSAGSSPMFVEAALRKLAKHRGSTVAALAAGHLALDWENEVQIIDQTEDWFDNFDFALAARAKAMSARLWRDAGDDGEAILARQEVTRIVDMGHIDSAKAFADISRMFRQAGDDYGEALCFQKWAWWTVGIWGEVDPRELTYLHAQADEVAAHIHRTQSRARLNAAEARFSASLSLRITPEALVGLSYVLARMSRFAEAWRALSRLSELSSGTHNLWELSSTLQWTQRLWDASPDPSSDSTRAVLVVVTLCANHQVVEGHPLSGARIVRSSQNLLRSASDSALLAEFRPMLRSIIRRANRGLDLSERNVGRHADVSLAETVTEALKIATREMARERGRVLKLSDLLA